MEHHSIRQLCDKFGRFCAGPVLLAEGGDDPLAAAGEPIAAGGEDPLAAGGDPLAAGGDDPLAAGGAPLAAGGDDPIATGGDDPLVAGGDPLAAGGDDLEVRSSSAISLNYVIESVACHVMQIVPLSGDKPFFTIVLSKGHVEKPAQLVCIEVILLFIHAVHSTECCCLFLCSGDPESSPLPPAGLARPSSAPVRQPVMGGDLLW